MLKQFQKDIIIIGSGIAGCIAAIEAHDLGANVVIIEKGLFSRSGSSVMASRFSVHSFNKEPLSDWGGGPYVQTGLIDNEELRLNHRAETAGNSQKSWEFLAELENMGALFKRYSNGKIWPQTASGCHSSKMDMTGKMIMQVLGAQVKKRKIDIFESTMATSILTQNSVANGITALDIKSGELIVISAKAVILATGSTSWYPTSTLPDNLTGDGNAIAFRAGAEIADICEIIFYNYKNPNVAPKRWGFQIADWNLKPMDWRESNTINKDGENIELKEEYKHWFDKAKAHGMDGKTLGVPLWLKTYVIACEIAAGRGNERGSIYVDYRHMKDLADQMKNDWWRYSFFKKIGIDPSKDLLEVSVVPHLERGGVVTNAKTESTTIPRLYAIGSAISGVGGLMGCISTAKWAAKYSVEQCNQNYSSVIDEKQIEVENNQISSLLDTEKKSEGYFPLTVKNMIKQVLLDKCFFWKNEKTMKDGLIEFHKIRHNIIPNIRLESSSGRFNQGLVDALEAKNLLDTSEIYIEMALRKKESRGLFRRTDYPEESKIYTGVRVKLENGKKKFRIVKVPIPWD